MEKISRIFCKFLYVLLLWLAVAGCGNNSVWRYNPGPAATPAELTAISGNGQVSLSWPAAFNATAYNIYYSSSPGVTAATGTKIIDIKGTSTIVTGLTNDVPYYFAISAMNAYGETPLSNEVSATPAAPGPFLQTDLQGTWYFNILVSGAAAKWMRGIATIDGSGIVTITSYLDSTNSTTAPTGLFPSLTVLPDGFVAPAGGGTDFHGVLSNNIYRDMLVGTASTGTSRMIAILQKRVAGITYSSSDIKGTGNTVAGPLPFVYHQLFCGVSQEWLYATGQVGQDQTVKYLSINAPTAQPLPGGGNKVVTLSITANGIVTETPIAGAAPQPSALLTWGVMSADKMTIVGTATAANGAFVLRVVQFVHPPSIPLGPSIYTLANLAGSYGFHELINGAGPMWAYGNLTLDASGAATFASYRDSSGSTALPASFALAISPQGVLTNSANPSYNGQLSYFNDMFVATGTESPGVYSLAIDLKR